MRRVGHAIGDLGLVEPGDRILVAVSGGKDSFVLLHILDLHRRRCRFDFSLHPVFLDAGWDAQAARRVVDHFGACGFEVEVVHKDIRSGVLAHMRDGSNPCGLCARMRRGVLYDLAPRRGLNKIALGHHLDDLAETLLMNLFYTGQIKSMAVDLRADDGRNHVIRPLAYVEESLVAALSVERGFEPVHISCPHHTAKTDPRRLQARAVIEEVARAHPRVRRNMLAAMRHVRPSHLLDPRLEDRSPGPAGTSGTTRGPRRKPR